MSISISKSTLTLAIASTMVILPAFANPSTSHYNASITNSHDKEQATLHQLAQDITWRRLLLLPDNPKHGNRSTIKQASFFLSQKTDNDIDPEQELIMLWQALHNPDQHSDVACRFPARIAWLNHHLPSHLRPPRISPCPTLTTWIDTIDAQALSLVFAAEHPNNPASGFAHTLLKVDNRHSLSTGDDSNATAINYTVLLDKKDGMITSGLKSLVGKYPAVMEIMPFSAKTTHYLSDHRRDLWQYRLKLNTQDINQIMWHLWEVKDMARPYYLGHDNCATEILRLVDLVRPINNLQKQAGKITIPAKATQVLMQAGLLDDGIYLPSDTSIAQAKYNQTSISQPNSPILPSQNKKYNPIYATPVHRVGWFIEKTHNQSATAVGLSLRSAYHDVLDRPIGVRQFLDLQTPSVDLTYQDNRLKLKNFTLFASRSYNPVNAINSTKNNAIGIHIGAKQVHDIADKQSILVANTMLELGKSWTIGQGRDYQPSNHLCYAFGATMGEFGNFDKGYRLGIGSNMGCIWHIYDDFRLKAEVNLPYWYQSHQPSTSDKQTKSSTQFSPKIHLGTQYDISPHHALRFTSTYEKQNQSTVNLQYLSYF